MEEIGFNRYSVPGPSRVTTSMMTGWVRDNSLAKVKEELEKGRNVNERLDNEKTYLYYARTPEMVALLLKHGADPKHKDKFGNAVSKSPYSGKYIREYLQSITVAMIGDPRFSGTVPLPQDITRTIAQKYLGGRRTRRVRKHRRSRRVVRR